MTKRTILAWAAVALLLAAPALAQPASKADPNQSHKHPTTGADSSLASQVRELQSQVQRLQAAMAQKPPPAMPGMAAPSAGQQAAPAGMMDDDMMMGGMMPAMGMGGGMSAGGMGTGMGCCAMMGQMPPGGTMAMSTLPGFPGASHLYHIGETGFFLDHPQHITLSPEQASRLGKLREEAMRARSDSERKTAAAEEQLWQLTAADQPAAAAVEAKVREIEKLRGDQRLAFIRAVGEAAGLLTDEQRRALLGQLPPSPNPVTGMGQAMPQMQSPGMGGGMMMDDSMEMPPMGGSGSTPPSGGGSMPSGGGGMGHM